MLPPGKGAQLGSFTALELIVFHCGRRVLFLQETVRPFPVSALTLEAQNGFACWQPDVDAYRNNHLDSRGGTCPIPRENCFLAVHLY